MARVPYTSRQIPIALPAAEVILTIPTPAQRGGDGWSALAARASGGTLTTLTWVSATSDYNDFEAAARTTNDRFNGLFIKSNGRIAIITDFADAAGTATFTFVSGALGPAPVAGQRFKVSADIPLTPAYLMLTAAGSDDLRFNIQDQAGLITAGQFSTIPVGASNLLIDNELGTPGFRIRVASAGVGATTAGLDIMNP